MGQMHDADADRPKGKSQAVRRRWFGDRLKNPPDGTDMPKPPPVTDDAADARGKRGVRQSLGLAVLCQKITTGLT